MPLPASSHYTHPECKSAFDSLANRNVIDIISCSQFPLEVIEIVKISRSSLLGDNVPLFSPVHGLSICPLWWIKLMWFSPKLLKHRRWIEKLLNNVQYKTLPSGCGAPRFLGGNMDTFRECVQWCWWGVGSRKGQTRAQNENPATQLLSRWAVRYNRGVLQL